MFNTILIVVEEQMEHAYHDTSRPRVFKNDDVSLNSYTSMRDNNHVFKQHT